jgi:DNA-directed RNA polymerase specialized sigma24 family protein/ribosome-associated translation inhibitor RaiA
MSDHMVFQDCPDWQKETIKSYWQQKVPRIEKLLTRFPEDQRELRLMVTHKPKRYDLHLVLLLPTASLAADASSVSDREAIDAVVDKLVAEIRRHKELIRREHLYDRKRHRQELSRHVEAQLQPESRVPDKSAFFELVSPLINRLWDHAHHELVVAELQGRIGREQIVVDDLLDEVVLRAWSRLNRRDDREPLEVWLARLLHDVLDQQIAGVREALPLDERVDLDEIGRKAPGEPLADDTPVWEPPSVVTLEDVLPSQEAGEPWEQLAAVDQMKWVMTQLSELPADRRRAFTLHVLDGWEPDDVAMIQGRSADDVRRDIEEVQRMLRSRLDSESEIHPSGSPSARHAE